MNTLSNKKESCISTSIECNSGRANKPMLLTPLRVPNILAFLKVRSNPNVVPIYQ